MWSRILRVRSRLFTLVDQLRRQIGDRPLDIDELNDEITAYRNEILLDPDSRKKVKAIIDLHDTRLLIVGFHRSEPRMYVITPAGREAPTLEESIAMIGIDGHARALTGKLFEWSKGLNLSDAKLLASILVCESGRCDVHIGTKINVAVVTRDSGMTMVEDTERAELNRRALAISDEMLAVVRDAIPSAASRPESPAA